jgi:hypothetical protein
MSWLAVGGRPEQGRSSDESTEAGMRWRWILGGAAIAGCAVQTVPGPDVAGIERACSGVVADHVGKPAAAVSARFDAVGADGVSVVVVTDAGGAGGERIHTCEVDAAGRVLAIRHPGA